MPLQAYQYIKYLDLSIQSIFAKVIRRPSSDHVISAHDKQIPKHPKRRSSYIQLAPWNLRPLHGHFEHWDIQQFRNE